MTDGLLATLARHRITAVGFVTWANFRADGRRELLDDWLRHGHELGNHSERHPEPDVERCRDLARRRRGRAAAGSTTFLARARRARCVSSASRTCARVTARPSSTPARACARAAPASATCRSRSTTRTGPSRSRGWQAPACGRRGGDGARRRGLSSERCASRCGTTRQRRPAARPTVAAGPAAARERRGRRAVGPRSSPGSRRRGHRFATADEVLADPAFAEPAACVGHAGFGLWDRLCAASAAGRGARAGRRSSSPTQAEAWTRGDLEAFCSVYAEDAVFVAPSGLTQRPPGGARTLPESLPGTRRDGSADARGHGDADGLGHRGLAPGRRGAEPGARRLGRGALDPAPAGQPDATGLTLLVLRPHGAGWQIVQDASM